MTYPHPRRTVAALLSVAAAASLASCSAGAAPEPSDAEVVISVSNLPSTENPERRDAFLSNVEAFESANPGVTVEPEETIWTADTFQSLVAGGTMPTVFEVPFTEIGSVIARGQAANLSEYLADFEILGNLNPAAQVAGQNGEGDVFGIPVWSYTQALVYNRALFEQAGLDPDAPPQTWEEVQDAAIAIEANTEAQGFLTMTSDNNGGWILTTMTNAFGSLMQSEDGAEVTIDNPATREVLEWYHTLRWDDDAIGSNFLINYDDGLNAMAAGQAGMYVNGSNSYSNLVINLGMDEEDFGLAPLPQTDDGLGTLGGGTFAIINPAATTAELEAGLRWVEFNKFRRYVDEDTAIEQAIASVEAGAAVGEPQFPVVGTALFDQWLAWVEPHINVPRDNFALYNDTVEDLPLVPEPPVQAQQLYAALDPIVQSVLTQEDTDIADLLEQADNAVQAIVDAG